MMKRKAFIVAIILMVFAAVLCASGGEPFAFLKLGVGTRATGMGSAFTSIADDSSGAYYNPAGSVNMKGLELMGETYILSFDRSINYISIAKPFELNDAIYAFGASWINNYSGSNIETRLTNSPEPDSIMSDSSSIFTFNLSTKLSDKICLGGNFKFLFKNLGAYYGIGVGFDLGTLIKLSESLNAGLSFSGISTNIIWNGSSKTESLPQITTAGLSYKFYNMFGAAGFSALPSIDFVYNSFNGFSIRAGTEISINDFVFLRGGYNNALTLGAGIRIKPLDVLSIKIDYAYVSDNIIPGAINHRIGLSLEYLFPQDGVEHNINADIKKPENILKNNSEPDKIKKKVSGNNEFEW
ncbi:MAG: PorV/PorQ family protein [bacterium]